MGPQDPQEVKERVVSQDPLERMGSQDDPGRRVWLDPQDHGERWEKRRPKARRETKD